MGNVSQIDPLADEVLKTLQAKAEDAEKGEIDGICLLCVYKSGRVVTDLKGAFSADIDDLSMILGRLDLLSKDLYTIVTDESDELD